MTQDEMKKQCAEKALGYIEDNKIIGVGTGSTVNFFIDALATIKHRIEGCIASSIQTEEKLKALKMPVYDLNTVDQVHVYIDGADEVNEYHQMIKGGGGAHTREKILATVAQKFICIADETKKVSLLGKNHPIPIEVIPMARSYVGRQVVSLGGQPVYRENFTTDNGNIILDAYQLDVSQPMQLEDKINTITGVVENGLFAKKTADIVL